MSDDQPIVSSKSMERKLEELSNEVNQLKGDVLELREKCESLNLEPLREIEVEIQRREMLESETSQVEEADDDYEYPLDYQKGSLRSQRTKIWQRPPEGEAQAVGAYSSYCAKHNRILAYDISNQRYFCPRCGNEKEKTKLRRIGILQRLHVQR
jgi:chromosome segregation ATPase